MGSRSGPPAAPPRVAGYTPPTPRWLPSSPLTASSTRPTCVRTVLQSDAEMLAELTAHGTAVSGYFLTDGLMCSVNGEDQSIYRCKRTARKSTSNQSLQLTVAACRLSQGSSLWGGPGR